MLDLSYGPYFAADPDIYQEMSRLVSCTGKKEDRTGSYRREVLDVSALASVVRRLLCDWIKSVSKGLKSKLLILSVLHLKYT